MQRALRSMIYTQAQKAVAVLLAMGKSDAAAVLERMSQSETELLLANSRKMRALPPEDLATVADDFENAFAHAADIYDADARFHQLVCETLRNETTQDPLHEFPASDEMAETFSFMAFNEASIDDIIEFLAGEDTLVSACLLSRLPGDIAGEVLQRLEEQHRSSIFRAMAAMEEPHIQALQAIDEAATAFINAKKAASNVGKLNGLAKVLNSIDRDSADSAIISLQGTFEDSDLSLLRSMLFRFEDVIKLEPGARSAVFDAISADTITLALRNTDEALREAILSSISQRTRRVIENDLKTQTKFNVLSVRGAQKSIVSAIMKLASEGVLKLPTDEQQAA
jgi:flagellar motor switch protein FliG